MLSNLLAILDDVIEVESSTSASEELFHWLEEICNIPLIKVGGQTITIGIIIYFFLSLLFKKFGTGKLVIQQENVINMLQQENETLKKEKADQEARIETLEAKMNVVTKYSQNKKIREAYRISIEPTDAQKVEVPLRKYKVKVKKARQAIHEQAVDVLNEVINNGYQDKTRF